jgi:hypothetical protein
MTPKNQRHPLATRKPEHALAIAKARIVMLEGRKLNARDQQIYMQALGYVASMEKLEPAKTTSVPQEKLGKSLLATLIKETATPVRKSPMRSKAFSFINITSILKMLVTELLYSMLGIALVSLFLEVPYFNRISEGIVLLGRLTIGFAFWIYVRATNHVWPWLCGLYHQHFEDTSEASNI